MNRNTIMKLCAVAVAMTFFLPSFLSESGSAKVVLSDGDMTAYGVTMDSQDNIIVTGSAYDDLNGKYIIKTEKYAGSDGHLIWSKNFDRYNYNVGMCVTADSNDNVIVAGSVNETLLEGLNYCLVKYNKDGKQLWYKTFNRKILDKPSDIIVDSANNLFVTGMSLKLDFSAGAASGAYWTMKCAPNGNLLKEKIFDESDADAAFGIALDRNNNIIVTGSSNHTGHLTYCTLKYDNNLNDIWGPVYYDSGNEFNLASGVAVDSHNNIIITGGSESGGNKDYLTVKYDNSGNKLKEDTYDFGGTDDAMGIAVDNNDNIVVTGISTSAAGEHFCTVKYNSNLGFQWFKKENFIGGARDAAVDSGNNIIVAGYKKSGGNHYYTIKYSPGGEIQWEGGGGTGPVEAPTADFTFTPANPTRADFVHFYDQSTGSITSWSWNFGDGATSSDENPLHKYSNMEIFTVTLTVNGPAGTDTKSRQISISNAGPVSSFSYNPPNPMEGQTVSFDASSSYDHDGSIASYSWDFGDDTGSSNIQNPTHQYGVNDTYTVTLSVTDNDGAIASTQKIITVNAEGDNIPPVPTFDYSPSNPLSGEDITFDASSSADADGVIELYRWDWNSDGTYDNEYTIPTAVHTWYENGEYTVTLQVKDDNDMINTYTENVNVGGGGNAELNLSSEFSSISIGSGKEKTITMTVKCFNETVSDVTIDVLENAGATVNAIPSSAVTINAGNTQNFSITIKMPQNFSGNEKIRLQAVGNEGIKSNIYEIGVSAKEESNTPGFATILAIGAIFIVLLFMKKMK